MRVSAFIPAVAAALVADGGVTASGLPLVRCVVGALPAHATVSIVLSVWTEAGADLNPRLYIVTRDPAGVKRSVWECAWQWPDTDGEPFKYRVFAHDVEIHVETTGVYQVGLFLDPDDTETNHWFPLTVTQ
jgi:hypothetical protein